MIFISSSSTRFDGVVVSEAIPYTRNPTMVQAEHSSKRRFARKLQTLPILNIVKNGIYSKNA